MRKIVALVVTLSLGLAAVGFYASPTYAAPPGQPRITQQVVPGFYQGRQVFYYTFQNGTRILDEGKQVEVGRQYRLVDQDGKALPGQYDLIAQAAYEDGYSDLREIIEVTAPDSYEVNTIRSVDDLLAQNWPQQSTGKTFNIPLVRNGTQLQGRDLDSISLWLNGEEVSAFGFGETPAQTAPIWLLITGYDATGALVRLPGQLGPIMRQLHHDPGYSDFWQVFLVTVPEDTPPNSIRSYEQIIEGGFPIEETSNVINCPVIRLENLAIGYYQDQPYYITRIDRVELPYDSNLPAIYTYVHDDGAPILDAPWVLSIMDEDESYTGYCQRVHVLLASEFYTNAATILSNANIDLQPTGIVSICAILAPVLTEN
jgi:hypothetical protein